MTSQARAGGTAVVRGPEAEDKKTRERVVDPEHSFLVRAPAGSGKTKLLTDRYVNLLTHAGADGVRVLPENIVCLTFTRKAAGEMRERIQKEIRERAPAYAGPEQRSRVNVHTIDAFQRLLVRADSFRAGIMPRFETGECWDSYNRALDRGALWRRSSCRRLTEYFSDKAIQRKMVSMLRRRDQWLDIPRTVGPPVGVRGGKEGEAWDVLDALGEVAEGELDRIFSMEREYDYIAVSRAATRLLGRLDGPPDLEHLLGYGILHILVDEFQDVSRAQRDFFSALTQASGRHAGNTQSRVAPTFLAVGDSMQSIYRFRGADTGVLFEMFEDRRCEDGDPGRLGVEGRDAAGELPVEQRVTGHPIIPSCGH